MNKKIIALLSVSLLLSACGWNKETPAQKKTETPTRIETGSLGEGNAGLTTDLNDIVEQAYQNAANSGTGTATASTGTANTP